MIPKFRAWVKPGVLSNHLDGVIAEAKPDFIERVCLVKRDDLIGNECFNEIFDFDDLILMQSTGLKDKNGAEIFEGDVCKLSGGLDDYWYIVEWLFAGWQLVTYKKPDAKVSGISDGINQCYLEPSIASNLGIVGNIYANPELLSLGIE